MSKTMKDLDKFLKNLSDGLMKGTQLRKPIHSGVIQLMTHPDNHTLVLSCVDDVIRIVKADTIIEMRGHTNNISSIDINSEGTLICSGSADRTVKLWDMNGAIVQNYNSHIAMVNKAIFSFDGKNVLTASDDNTAMILPITIDQVFQKLNKEKVRGEINELSDSEKKIYGIPLNN